MKHLLLATLALFFSATAIADTVKQVVNGTCPTDVKRIYVFYNTEKQLPADSIKVVNGQFKTTLNVEKNTFVNLRNDISAIPFYADGTPVSIDFNNYTSTGSELNSKLGQITKELSVYNLEFEKLYKEYVTLYHEENSSEEDKKRIDEMEPLINAVGDKLDSIEAKVFNENRTNLIGAAYLSDMMYGMEYAELKELLSTDNELTRHPLAEPAKKLYAALSKRAPGSKYTDFTMNDTEGKPHKLSEWVGKGNYVMIDCWASWCGPCRAEMPNVAANYAKYHSKGLEVIGISFDSKLESWKKAIDSLDMPWIHLSDLKGWNTIASSTYGINSIPASILIDPNGTIVAIDLRGEKLGDKLKEIYGE